MSRQIAPDLVGPDVFSRLAQKFREVARQEHLNNGSGAEACTVTNLAPLTVEALNSDLVLMEGDPDFTIGALMQAHIAATPLVLGDQVWVLREGQNWHLVDVAGAGS